MADDDRRRADENRRRREAAERSQLPGFAVCLHCGNAFRVADGIVTADAALCDVCNSD